MAIKPVSGEVKSQDLNDNFSFLNNKLTQVSGGPLGVLSSETELNSKYPNGANGFFLINDEMWFWEGNKWVNKGAYPVQGIADDFLTTPMYQNLSVTAQKLNKFPLATENIVAKISIYKSGFAINPQGIETVMSGWNISDKIKTNNKLNFRVRNQVNGISYLWVGAAFDKNNKYISGIENKMPIGNYFEFSVPFETDYIRVNYYNNLNGYELYEQGDLGTENLGWLLASNKNFNDNSLSLNKLQHQAEKEVDMKSKLTLSPANNSAINPSGNVQSIANWNYTEKFDLPENRFYRFKSKINGTAYSWIGCVYDNDGNYIEGIMNNNLDNDFYDYVAPLNAKKMIVNVRSIDFNDYNIITGNSSSFEIQTLKVTNSNFEEGSIEPEVINKESLEVVVNEIVDGTNSLSDKKVGFLGDSITFGYGLQPNEKNFVTLLNEHYKFKEMINYGISGTRIAKVTGDNNQSISERYKSMKDELDIIFVMGATNDYGHGTINSSVTANFGSFDDRTNSTFYGACHVLFKGLIEKYPNAKIYVMTTPKRLALSGKIGDYLVINPDTQKNLQDYVNAYVEVANYYSIEIIDLFNETQINPIIDSVKNEFMPDGLHPNKKGHSIIFKRIARYIK